MTDDYRRPAFSLASTSYQNNNASSSGYHEEVSHHLRQIKGRKEKDNWKLNRLN